MGESRRRSRRRPWQAWLCGVALAGAGLSGTPAGAATPAVAPGAPKITAATPGIHSVTIAFAKASANGGPRVIGYRVTCTSPDGGAANSHQGFSSPITVASLTPSKTYRCTVVAITKSSTGPPSAPSAAVTTLPTVPGAPAITAVTPGFHNVTVSFKATTTGGAPITSYKLTCHDDEGLRSHQSFKSPITIACVNGAETYTCSVAAENRIGWSHSSPTSSPALSLPTTPGPPTIASVTAGIRSATVAVNAPVNDGGVRVTSYRVTCTSANGGVTGAHQAFKSPITVAGLSAGFAYTCTAAAINAVTTGPGSAPSASFVPLSN